MFKRAERRNSIATGNYFCTSSRARIIMLLVSQRSARKTVLVLLLITHEIYCAVYPTPGKMQLAFGALISKLNRARCPSVRFCKREPCFDEAGKKRERERESRASYFSRSRALHRASLSPRAETRETEEEEKEQVMPAREHLPHLPREYDHDFSSFSVPRKHTHTHIRHAHYLPAVYHHFRRPLVVAVTRPLFYLPFPSALSGLLHRRPPSRRTYVYARSAREARACVRACVRALRDSNFRLNSASPTPPTL